MALTATAFALPNTENGHFTELLSAVREGLELIRYIEEIFDEAGGLVNVMKVAKLAWERLDISHSSIQLDLHSEARRGRSSQEILTWLGDEAAKTVIHFKSSKKEIAHRSGYKFIPACAMY